MKGLPLFFTEYPCMHYVWYDRVVVHVRDFQPFSDWLPTGFKPATEAGRVQQNSRGTTKSGSILWLQQCSETCQVPNTTTRGCSLYRKKLGLVQCIVVCYWQLIMTKKVLRVYGKKCEGKRELMDFWWNHQMKIPGEIGCGPYTINIRICYTAVLYTIL